MHSAVQTAVVTVISYKPLSGLNFARYTEQYGSYMPSSPSGVYKPLVQANKIVFGLFPVSWLHLGSHQSENCEALEALWTPCVVEGLTVAAVVLHSLEYPSRVCIGYPHMK